MNYQTLPHTTHRACVDLVCRKLNLGGVPDAGFPSKDAGLLPEKPSMRDIARLCAEHATPAERAGFHQGMVDFAARAMTTSDFAAILTDVGNKQLLQAYTTRPASFSRWASAGYLPNFKQAAICRVSGPSVLPELREDDEYKALVLEDGAENVRLKTYGGLLAITRQSIVNDDLDALTDKSRLLAQSAALTQSTLAVAALTGNNTLSDGTAVFHADRNNLLTGATSALSVDSLAAGVAAMRRFKDVNGQPLAIEPKFLVVGPGNERLAYQLAYSDADPGTSNSGTVNFIKKSVGLEVIVEPMLENSSLTAWYLLPDPAVVPVIRYFIMDGNNGLAPYIESRNGFNNDNLELKTRIDFAAAAIGYFAVKSAGV
jgi:hypothetical protein